ncbi:hypothetical protein SAMN04488012_108155 [Palleronia salina]|uniref:Sulfotransferase family protein n=1 Tax=Palleronia salina TaxID=313368 RepID=A0A1M6IY92_9RHOB|nr:hypothetical protein [Palleronia salina]SHJ39403.1 hypothetical protein SAMN04488012_108155 [Palleronia salina]
MTEQPMRISFHIGAHMTEGERLIKSLLRNRDALDHAGVCVPGPSRYRPVLRDVLNTLMGKPADPDTQDAVLETILEGASPDHLVLSNSSFISVPAMAVGEGQLYPRMYKAGWLRNIFPDHPVDFHMCVRDMTTFLPAIVSAAGDDVGYDRLMGGTDPRQLRWSVPVRQLLEACPDATLTLWCYEDMPLLWEELMRTMAGVGPDLHLTGRFDLTRHLMCDEGMPRLRAYLAAHPPKSRTIERRIIAAFLDKFADPDAIMAQPDLPDWNQDLLDDLTTIYEADLGDIARMERVRILSR